MASNDASDLRPPASVPAKGERFAGRYIIDEVIGQGGTGVIHAARDMDLRRRVAIKFLLPEALKQPNAAERFLREGRAAAAMRSEHVARVLDIGKGAGGAPYIVMEHLTGTDLRAVIEARGPLPVVQAVDYVLQACEAIAEAHGLGILHRDLKPSNLFLAELPDGSLKVKVLDFGLSKATDAAGVACLTTTDMVAGSPHAMSPEQVRSLKRVDARTDVWSLGVILYHFLAGRPPFDGETVTATIAKILTEAPAPLQTVRPDLPVGLEDVVLACLQKEMGSRLASVVALANALAPHGTEVSRERVVRIERLSVMRPSTFSIEEGEPVPPAESVAEDGVGDALPSVTKSFVTPLRSAVPNDPEAIALARGTTADLGETARREPSRTRAVLVAVVAASALLAGAIALAIWPARVQPTVQSALARADARVDAPAAGTATVRDGLPGAPPTSEAAPSQAVLAATIPRAVASTAALGSSTDRRTAPKRVATLPSSSSVPQPASPQAPAPRPAATADPMDRWQ